MSFLLSLALAAFMAVSTDPDVPPSQVVDLRVRIDIVGSVRHPGLYSLPLGARVVDAIRAAGGPAHGAALNEVELADLLQDGETIQVPARQAADGGAVGGRVRQERAHLRARVEGSSNQEDPSRSQQSSSGQPQGEQAKIDLNRASADQLEQLPGVGPGLAGRILDYRAHHGRFHSVSELREVSGIGDRRLQRIAPYVAVH